ncbi:MAG: MFS transporter [Anaerolineae bacterium]|nr:MFS transporter [Chloroflexota bacterium]
MRDTEQRNIALLSAEVIPAAVLAAAASFNSTYVLRGGGSAALVGWLAAAPALVAVLCFMPAARWMERQGSYRALTVLSLLAARLPYLGIALLPLVMSRLVPEITVGVLVAMAIPSVVFSTGWSTLLADTVPERRRAATLSLRSILSSGTMAVLTYLFGLALDRGVFPTNYQWLYLIGALGGLVSTALVAWVRVPRTEAAMEETSRPAVSQKQAITEAFRGSPGFVRLTVNTFLFNTGAWLVGPLYILYYVQDLGATDSWVGLHTALVHVGIMLGYWGWRRINAFAGDHPSLLMALPLVAAYPAIVSAFPNLPVLLMVGLLGHLFIAGVDLNHALIFMRKLPAGHRHTAIAAYSLVMNIGAFVGPAIGVALAEAIGIRTTLLIGGLVRAVGVVLFYLRPVDEGMLRRGHLGVALGALLGGRHRRTISQE